MKTWKSKMKNQQVESRSRDADLNGWQKPEVKINVALKHKGIN